MKFDVMASFLDGPEETLGVDAPTALMAAVHYDKRSPHNLTIRAPNGETWDLIEFRRACVSGRFTQ